MAVQLVKDYVQRQTVDRTDLSERRRRYMVRWRSMEAERARQFRKWRQLTDYIMPERGRFLSTDHNATKDTSKILNNTPTRMARVNAAGLMSGCTPRIRPWFNLTLPDPDLAKWGRVKQYLFDYNLRMRQVFDLAGLYRALAMGVYPDLAVYGLGTCLMEEDPTKVMRFIPLAMGSYALAQDAKGQINCLMYEEPWTVGELVNGFGWENVSGSVKTAWNAGWLEQYVNVLRVIMPNEEFVPGALGPRGAKWGSVYMEIGGLNSSSGALAQPSTDPTIGFLEEKGYQECPILCFRWATTARDVYPTGPGHDALPDARQLMQLESRKLLMISKGGNPGLLIPEAMRVSRLSTLPGDPIYLPSGVKADDIKPSQTVDPAWMPHLRVEISAVEQRVAAAFFADLMRRLIDKPEQSGKQPVTAEEIVETKQEIMLQLGPVLENTFESLSNLIDRGAACMERRRLAPVPPPEIQGMDMKVEFISILAQAQKLLYTSGKERFVAFSGQLAQLMAAHGNEGPARVVDNINADTLQRGYADDIGLIPNGLNDEEEVQRMRQLRAQAAQEQEQKQAMLEASEAAKNLGKTPLGEDNLLSRVVGTTQAGAQ